MPWHIDTARLALLYTLALLGSIIGAIAALYLIKLKVKNTVTGQRQYAHDEYTRRQGRILLLLLSILPLVVLLYYLFL